ncbi:MAG: isoprenylcysteine carboxylmethyltransferase family protein [Sphingobacteriaceae bacterium]|nr:isoprenylcysteine carboxylmethyltransferase family protein [Sphingobacteriaceae bacterium]
MKTLTAKDILFVGLQFLLFIIFFLVPFDQEWHLPFWIKLPSLALALIGLLLAILAVLQLKRNLSPFPSPLADGTLIQTGLYKKVRHPAYTGLLLFFFGYALWEASLFKLFIALLLLLLFYFKTTYEEKLLTEKFPDYKDYQKQSWRFFPFL